MSRIVGLDVGEKTIGVAVSDPLGLTAQGVEVWRRKTEAEDLQYLRDLTERLDAAAFVVGLPRRTDGSLGPEAQKTLRFGRAVERATGRPVEFWDERFTTAAAQKALIATGMRRDRRKNVIDMAAAALILQGYMERRRNDGDDR